MTTKTKKPFELAKADLARSGIVVKTPADLERMGMRALSPDEALEFMPERWTRHAPEGLCCLKLDYHGIDGKPTGFWRLRRLDDAPATAFGVELSRYVQADGTRPYLWFSKAVDWPKALAAAGRGKVRVVFVEGEKKAECVCKHGGGETVAIALGGVWNTGSKRLGIEVIPDVLEASELALGFRPVVCFDSDAKLKTRLHVERAAMRLGELLRSQGAEPLVATLPEAAGSKVAVDDLVAERGWPALAAVLDAAAPLFPPAELTDVGNATRLARRASGDFLYVPQWRRWLRWDGRRWADDDQGAITGLAVEVTKEMLVESGKTTAAARDADDGEKLVKAGANLAKHALASQRKERVAAMVHLAPSVWSSLRADPRSFDADPWLLNVENGTVDLRTGELRPHDPGDLITRLAPVRYEPGRRAVRFERFMEEVLPSRGLRSFMQRFLGYALTGDVREHKLAFLHGDGRNGKSVLMKVVARLMGDYASTVPEGLLVAQKFEAHPTELTTLRGLRLALVSEVGKGRSWNESRLKRLTGGDDVTARGMGQDFYTFPASHKFVCLSNPRPRVDADDHAVWERLKPVPFAVTFRDPDDRDPDHAEWPVADRALEERLMVELPGILNWLVEGCLAWRRDGLGEPEELREATREYQDEQRELDPLTQFLRTNVVKVGQRLDEIANQFNKYVEVNHSKRGLLSSKELAAKLRKLGHTVEKAGAGGWVRVTNVPNVIEMPERPAQRARKF